MDVEKGHVMRVINLDIFLDLFSLGGGGDLDDKRPYLHALPHFSIPSSFVLTQCLLAAVSAVTLPACGHYTSQSIIILLQHGY